MIAPNALTENKRDFDPKKFLATIGDGRKVVAFPMKRTVFTQGDAADYVQEGGVRLTVVSKIGKEATIGILGPGDFFGEGPCRTTFAQGICYRNYGLRTYGH